MSSTTRSSVLSASMAAAWLGPGAQSMVYWWIFTIAPRTSGGAAAKATRQPVMAWLLEKPPRRTVRSRIPGSDGKLVCACW